MELLAQNPFYELSALLALAAAVGLVGLMLRQPLIVAFIATGILAGPDALGIVHSAEQIDLLAEIGIAVLLFLVGLKLDVQIVRSLGAVAVATGLGQVGFTAGIGFLICLALGLDWITSAYVAVALTFSSTIIIVKLLSDKREVDSLHGRIALGFLIVQDIFVVLAMVALSAYGVGADKGSSGMGVPGVLLSGLVMVGLVWLFIRYVAERLMRRVSRLPELMLTFALAWAVLFAALADWLGLGKEIGGLLAGVSLASTSFREAVASRLSSLRDFLLLFFFIGLGSRLDLDLLGSMVPEALALSAFVLAGNPLIVLLIMGAMGYRKRTGFLAGLTVAQISEFSLIFMGMGLTLGHVLPASVGLVTLVGLITITLSTYMIIYSQTLYRIFEPWLDFAERAVPHRESSQDQGADGMGRHDVLLFGLGRYGFELGKILTERGAKVMGVDFDPRVVERWRTRGNEGTYGDAADPEFPASLPVSGISWVVIATTPLAPGVTHSDNRLALIEGLRQAGYEGRIAVRCDDPWDARRMTAAGVDTILMPFVDAAGQAADVLGFPTDADGGGQQHATA